MGQKSFSKNICAYQRLETSCLTIGDLGIGGQQPVQVQSMCSTPASDVQASFEQCAELAHAGCGLVRFTVPSLADARAAEQVVNRLRGQGIQVPVVADIHYSPKAAEVAARFCDKVRINPGNYSGDVKYKSTRFTDEEYQEELKTIGRKLKPLLDICDQAGTAIRIGVNQGSLSARVVDRYGDTPQGMAQSAIEYIDICEIQGFDRIVVSLKSSNVKSMIIAYRLLVGMMKERRKVYPLHIGVTEAGSGDQGRIKSAMGSGLLLADGVGDTIRVSLTEEPVNEIPVAREIVDYYSGRDNENTGMTCKAGFYPFLDYAKAKPLPVGALGHLKAPLVIGQADSGEEFRRLQQLPGGQKPDMIYTESPEAIAADLSIARLVPQRKWAGQNNTFPVIEAEDYAGKESCRGAGAVFIGLKESQMGHSLLAKLKNDPRAVLIAGATGREGFYRQRALFCQLAVNGLETPVVIRRTYSERTHWRYIVKASGDMGGLLIDGMGSGLWPVNSKGGRTADVLTAFRILQASRLRISETEYISCPTCGRTRFDMLGTLDEVKRRTAGLKGLKIAVMGCIVNGPGEMADADYGYVGAGPGRVALYKGRDQVRGNVPEGRAVDGLIQLIKENGDWE
jgi:(E)-4-hydroxy-3-methylbut-2-enyl-diphosphate synthase